MGVEPLRTPLRFVSMGGAKPVAVAIAPPAPSPHRRDQAATFSFVSGFIFGVDLDGVCADYSIGFREFVAAERGYIDEVILPHNTRRRICRALNMLRNKTVENPWKKHDNIPL